MRLEDIIDELSKKFDIPVTMKDVTKISKNELYDNLSKYRSVESTFYEEFTLPNNRIYYFNTKDQYDSRFSYIGVIIRNYYFDLMIVIKTYLEKMIWFASMKRAKNGKYLF